MRVLVSRRRSRTNSTAGRNGLATHLSHLVFGLFLTLIVLGGGASRNDAASQPLIWIVAVLCICAFSLQLTKADLARIRLPILFLGTCVGLQLVQLTPLPPGIWGALPGRSLYAEIDRLTGIGPTWRPLSVRPQATVASILSFMVPAALMLGYARSEPRWLVRTLPLVVGVAMCSAILGLAQLGSGPGGALRHYAVTNSNYAVGLFANRNHQALFLVCALPLAPVAAKLFLPDPSSSARTWVPVCIWALLIPMILLTGSRAGALLTIPALGIGLLLLATPMHGEFLRRKHQKRLLGKWVPIAAIAVVVTASIAFSRSVAIDRLFATDAQGELRTRLWQSLLETAGAFFPFGSGLGSFDPVYRRFEPFELLRPDYTNMAHNDALQLVIEAGLPGILLAILFLGWFLVTTVSAWKRSNRVDARLLAARCGSVVLSCGLLASIVDYPLRTPLFASVFTIAALWLNDFARHAKHRQNPPVAR